MTSSLKAQDMRAIVRDDNERIVLTVYGMRESRPIAEFELPPLHALRLARELTAAACRHLDRADAAE